MPRSVELAGRTSRVIVFASVCLIVTALYFGQDVLIPLALAIVFTFLLSPLVGLLERLNLPRIPATLTVIAIAIGAVVLIGYVVGSQIETVFKELPQIEAQFKEKLSGLRRHSIFLWKAEKEIHNFGAVVASSQPAQETNQAIQEATGQTPPTTQPMPVRIVSDGSGMFEAVRDWGSSILKPLATASLVLILVIFMLFKREDLRDRMIRLIGHGRLNLTTQALDEAGSRISRYLGALAIVNSAYGLCIAGGLLLIGHFLGHGHPFPNVLVWGLLVCLFRFVPYIGIWIAAGVLLLLSFAIFPGSTVFFAVLGLFVIFEVVVSQFVEPYWYGASTGMSALAVLVAAIFWTWLWGGIGLFLSTPLTVCLVVMGKYIPQLQFLDILLGDEPVLPPHIRFYQRLIADDEDEATEIAREELKKTDLQSVYDGILLPVLALAEHDSRRQRMDLERLQFIRQAIRNMLEELRDEAQTPPNETSPAAKKDEAEKLIGGRHVPKDCSIYVTTIPANNESDQIVAEMLSQLLELRGYCAVTGSAEMLASELVAFVEKNHTQIVCISALPPAAVSRARYLCKKLQARESDLSMLVGLWTLKSDPQRSRRRLACSENARLATTLSEAQHEIGQLAQHYIATGATVRNAD